MINLNHFDDDLPETKNEAGKEDHAKQSDINPDSAAGGIKDELPNDDDNSSEEDKNTGGERTESTTGEDTDNNEATSNNKGSGAFKDFLR